MRQYMGVSVVNLISCAGLLKTWYNRLFWIPTTKVHFVDWIAFGPCSQCYLLHSSFLYWYVWRIHNVKFQKGPDNGRRYHSYCLSISWSDFEPLFTLASWCKCSCIVHIFKIKSWSLLLLHHCDFFLPFFLRSFPENSAVTDHTCQMAHSRLVQSAWSDMECLGSGAHSSDFSTIREEPRTFCWDSKTTNHC